MYSGLSADHIAGVDPLQFEQRVSSYAQQRSILLRENPWAFWKRDFWTVRALGAARL